MLIDEGSNGKGREMSISLEQEVGFKLEQWRRTQPAWEAMRAAQAMGKRGVWCMARHAAKIGVPVRLLLLAMRLEKKYLKMVNRHCGF